MNPDDDCFADEVPLDFPSLGPLATRLRKAFLAEGDADRTGPLKAEVCLSSHDAHRGATVPLGVPVLDTCHACGGRGETWAERCVVCAGTGDVVTRHRLRVTIPPRVADGSRFHFRFAAGHAAVHVQVSIAIRA